MNPGDYLLRSPKSRAAARALLASKRTAGFEGLLIHFVTAESPDSHDRKCTCPIPPEGTVAFCRCFCEPK
jgi:hypothetical protein